MRKKSIVQFLGVLLLFMFIITIPVTLFTTIAFIGSCALGFLVYFFVITFTNDVEMAVIIAGIIVLLTLLFLVPHIWFLLWHWEGWVPVFLR
jgi:hypothetical protein